MDIQAILKELQAERQQLDEAIFAIERLGAGAPKRRGRPPKWMDALKGGVAAQDAAKRRGRPPGSKKKSATA